MSKSHFRFACFGLLTIIIYKIICKRKKNSEDRIITVLMFVLGMYFHSTMREKQYSLENSSLESTFNL